MQSHFLLRTFDLANRSVENGNHPFGALLVIDGKIVAEALNTVLTERDVTRHAELALVSQVTAIYSGEELERATLYTSTEPCAMCSGAIVWSGIKKVVFGCSSKDLNRIARGKFSMSCQEIFSHSQDSYEVEGPLFEKEARQIHEDYWS